MDMHRNNSGMEFVSIWLAVEILDIREIGQNVSKSMNT